MSRVSRFLALLLILAAILLPPAFGAQAATQSPVSIDPSWTCESFTAWTWAQTAFELDPDRLAALDPDGEGVACKHLPVDGFGPVLWRDSIPTGSEAAHIVSVTDGDTIRVAIDGVEDRVRLYHINAPETKHPNVPTQCGGAEAASYMEYVLGFVPDGTVWLEYDETHRDRYDRRLAYIWFQIGNDVYMVNEIMVRNGWAESETYKPDVKYKTELDVAEQFSVDHVLGVRLLCGTFGQPLGEGAPSRQQLRQARQRQPDQGQFAGIVARENRGHESQSATTTGNPDPGCERSYPDVCIPLYSEVGDLNCKDIAHRRFRVLPPDPHNFDGDGDGIGCEGD